jgi:hypothetical protein
MHVSFHTDPVDIEVICLDLQEHGAVFVETTRTNFDKITQAVLDRGTRVLPLSTQGADGDFHNFLLYFEDNEYDSSVTNSRVLKAIMSWRAAGSPCPHIERI